MRKPEFFLLPLAALFLLGLFSTELSDPDAWWHLATGRYIVAHHQLPVPDPFAYTTALSPPASPAEARTRRFNLTHEWLAQAAWYLIETTGGFGAVVFWKAFLLALLCSLTGLVTKWRTDSWLWAVAAALATASLATEFAHDRPSILSYVFTAAFIAIFENRKHLWILPPLLLLWANCHGGFFLGWIVCAAYAAEALLRRAPDARRLVTVSAIAVAVSGLNPNGFAVIPTLLNYRQSALQASLTEWARADLWGSPYAFDLLLYAAAACLIASWKRVRAADWFLFAAFAAAAVTAFRNELLVGLLAPILIASYFPWKRRLPVAASYAAAAALLLALVWGSVRGSFFQLRAAEWRYPAGAAQFLRDHRITAHLFNTYEYGGYLIWAGQPVFIDGRALSESVFQDYRMILGTPPGDARRDQTLSRYAIGAIVVNSFEYNSGALYPLVLALAQPDEAQWKLVYRDPQSLVFLRNSPPDLAPIDKSQIALHLEAECTLHVERDPEFSLCARTLGDLFMRSGDRERARRALGLYLAHPYQGVDDAEARRAYTSLLQQ
ncbi:MAG TPA: hypothetical protein VG456_04365 [Candidatus Sulfopaludibacter sp.]|nr:hypothetical protein [Candidatus Sulfopaludibacter sp.]